MASIHRLTRGLETGTGMSLELIDATRDELEADLLSSRAIDTTAAYKLLVEPSVGTAGASPWTLLITDLTFGGSGRDLALLWRLGQVAAAGRHSAHRGGRLPARRLCVPGRDAQPGRLAGPSPGRRLVRPPAQRARPLPRPRPAPRLAAGTLRPGDVADRGLRLRGVHRCSGPRPISGATRPSHWRRSSARVRRRWPVRPPPPRRGTSPTCPCASSAHAEDGEAHAKPWHEVLLTTRVADRLLSAGLMPLQSIRDRDAIRLAGLTSIADPPGPLAFR